MVKVEKTVLVHHSAAQMFNLVDGVADGFDANRKVVDYTAEGGELEVVTGTGKSLAMDAPGEKGQWVRAAGEVQLSLGNFIELGGSLAFERARQVVTLADGTRVQTEMISIGGTDLAGFVGIGPYGTDTDQDGGLALGQRLCQTIAGQPAHCNGLTIAYTVSIGVTGFRAGDPNFDAVLARADSALYQAKRHGRNQVAQM